MDNLPVYVHDVPAAHLPPEVVAARQIHAGRIFACKDPTDVTPRVLLFVGFVGGVLATMCGNERSPWYRSSVQACNQDQAALVSDICVCPGAQGCMSAIDRGLAVGGL